MPKKGKSNEGFDDRLNRQNNEGYPTVSTNLPEERFSASKQVAPTDAMGVNKNSIADPAGEPTDPRSAAAKQLKAKIKIRPEVSVEELEGKQVGGVPLVGAMTAKSVAGVSPQSVVDDVSKIPYSKGGYRPDSRYGKKRSEDLFELDNQVAEQVAPFVEDSLDLREAPDKKQGYNGRKQFKQTRGKKNFKFVNGNNHNVGKLPQQLLQDVSVDFINTDKTIYTSGQMITGAVGSDTIAIPIGGDYPTKRHDGSSTPVEMHKGNYLLKNMTLTISNGHITGISFAEDNYEIHTNPVSKDESNMNLQVDTNNVAKSVVRLQKELGRETNDKWSPLGYVIDETYEHNMLMHDIEASTGAIMSIAYRAAVSSGAFQRNIAGKDGVNPQRNAVKMITEGYIGPFANTDANAITDTAFDHVIFNKAAYRNGSVAAIIEMFDSTKKYRTKADILGLQRSLSLHLSQCDNNLNPLHVKPNFLKVLDKAHMFSTPTGEYNPFLPIMATRVIKIVNPLSLNVFATNWKNPALFTDADKADIFRDQETGTYANYSYSYTDMRSNVYVTRVQHPVVDGLIRWLLKHEGAVVATYGDNTTVSIPAGFNFQAPSMFEFMLCSASQDVLWERNITFRDVLFAGDQEQYIWDDLAPLSKVDPLYSTQLKINKYDQALTLGKMASDSMVREYWNDHIQVTAEGSNKVQYMLSWHYNEAAFGSTAGGAYTVNEGFLNEERAFNMSIPSIRDGVRHEYVDVIKSMDERDIRLSIDRRTDIPVYSHLKAGSAFNTYSNYNSSTVMNKIKLSSLRYDPNSDGRVIATYDCINSADQNMWYHSLYCCPKELGWIDDLYIGKSVVTEVAYDQNHQACDVTATTLSSESTYSGMKSYNGYSPMYITSYRVSGDSNTASAIDRSAALTQVAYNCFAAVDAKTIDDQYVAKTGIIPALSYNDGQPQDVYGVYNLGSNNESTSAIDITIRTFAPRVWTILQRFFLPINRFENVFAVNENVDYDPLEESFYFGVCGTLASDYTQDVLERLDVYDQLGIDYTEDTFCRDSLIFR